MDLCRFRPGKDVFMSCGGGGAKAAKEAPSLEEIGRDPCPQKNVGILWGKTPGDIYIKMSGGNINLLLADLR